MSFPRSHRAIPAGLAVLAALCSGQTATLRPAQEVYLPPVIDGNSAAVWLNGEFRLFHSAGMPNISRGADQFSLGAGELIAFDSIEHQPAWFEAAWVDDDGTIFLWYHHEPQGLCGGNGLTAPKIGAAVSYDGGRTVHDLGVVLESGEPVDCTAKNGFFGGGHGDMSVVLDEDRNYFYLFFTNYGGALKEQGVAVARLAFADRTSPAGAVFKYYSGDWTEPGLGGHVTPVFPARQSWQRPDTNSFWGPAVHWNTFLRKYVILLNHSCCSPGWPQEGVYITYSPDLATPASWLPPLRLMTMDQIGYAQGYYPQVLGLEEGGTDRLAGEVARLYVQGRSVWEIVFSNDDPQTVVPPDDGQPDPGPIIPELRRTRGMRAPAQIK